MKMTKRKYIVPMTGQINIMQESLLTASLEGTENQNFIVTADGEKIPVGETDPNQEGSYINDVKGFSFWDDEFPDWNY